MLAEMMITVNVLVPKARNATVRDDVDLLLAAIRQTTVTYTARHFVQTFLFIHQDITVSLFLPNVYTVYVVCTSTQLATSFRYSRRAIVILPSPTSCQIQPSNPLTCKNVAHAPDLAIKSIELT